MNPPATPLDRLKARLAQVDALIAEGVLKGDAARLARDDLERQVLASVLGGGAASPEVPLDPELAAPRLPRLPRRLVAGVGTFVLAFGALGYAWLGNHEGWQVGPGEPGAATAESAAPHSTDAAQIEAMIAKLAQRLKDKPDDAEGWSMLARSYTALGKFQDAVGAYKKAFELRPQDAQTMADYADGLAVLNNRSLDGEPEKLIMQAVKLDPGNVKALALAGTVAFNHADYKAAVDYWQHAVQASDPAGDFTKQLQGALDEARKRAGLPPQAPGANVFGSGGPAADSAPEAAAPAPAGAAAATPGASVSGRVTLKDIVKGKVGPDDTVFIFARAPSGSRMPLAILRKKVSDLPLDFTLDDSLAMSPAMRISSLPQVVVGARISKSGNAMPQPGDWQVLSAPTNVGAKGLRIEIGEAVQ